MIKRFLMFLVCLTIGFGGHFWGMVEAGSQTVNLSGIKTTIWEPSQPKPKSGWPLILFSHGFHGSSTQSTFLCKLLADSGYLVVAPNHQDAGVSGGLRPEEPFGKAEQWTEQTFKSRNDNLQALVDDLKKDTKWSRQIDWKKVGLAGHSLGGYTCLASAGALPSWKLKGVEIRCLLAVSPYTNPLIDHGQLEALKIPVMFQGGTHDFGITPGLKKKGGAYQRCGGPSYLVEFQGAGHLAWTDRKTEHQSSIGYYSLAFFDRYLRGDASIDLSKRRSDVAELVQHF